MLIGLGDNWYDWKEREISCSVSSEGGLVAWATGNAISSLQLMAPSGYSTVESCLIQGHIRPGWPTPDACSRLGNETWPPWDDVGHSRSRVPCGVARDITGFGSQLHFSLLNPVCIPTLLFYRC